MSPLHLLPLITLSHLASPTRAAATCTAPPPSPTPTTYPNCTPLPTLSATLHWAHTPSNHTLSIAFTAAPPSPAGWVAWGINPTSTGMAGTQAIFAFQAPNGLMTVKTLDIMSYRLLKEGNLSFVVYDKSAVFNPRDGSITVFATVECNGNKLNLVWQVGSKVDSYGEPSQHEFASENLNSISTLDLSVSSGGGGGGGGGVGGGGGSGGGLIGGGKVENSKTNDRVHKRNVIHGILNAVSWGTLFPLGAIMARYLRTFESADPAWFYLHVTCQMSGYAVGVAGWATGLQLGSESKGIVHSTHRYLGIALFCLATCQISALFLRPKKDHKYRIYWNVYHHSFGYAILVIGIINVFKGLEILQPEKKWKSTYVTILVVLGCISIILEAFTWIVVLKRKPKRLSKPNS